MRSDFDTRFIQLLLVAVIVLLTKDDSIVWRMAHPMLIIVWAAAWAAFDMPRLFRGSGDD
jgi:hypothetical protein